MYKKAVSLLGLAGFMFIACSLCVKGMDAARLSAEPVMMFRLGFDRLEEIAGEKEEEITEKTVGETQIVRLGKGGRHQNGGEKGLGIVDIAVSGQRIVGYSVMELKYVYLLSEEDLETLLRIVEAEAGSEDEDGKLLVANVVLNRMNSEIFPDTVSGVVFQREKGVSQFSPVANGSFYRVKISEGTVNAVERALMGEDISQGALYFVARKYADSDKVKWFDRNLTYLFKHGGHEFFK